MGSNPDARCSKNVSFWKG